MTIIATVAAQRIALAATVLDDLDPRLFTLKLAEKLGLPISEDKLAGVTMADLKRLLADETREADQDIDRLKLAVRYLWGEMGDDAALPRPDREAGGHSPGGLRVAVASNRGEILDGHFGSCTRFLIYQVSHQSLRLVEIRPTSVADEASDRTEARCALINDCRILYVQSIGGPAAAKVVRAGIHPLRIPASGPALDSLVRLQEVLKTPPPWLAKLLGVTAPSRRRFEPSEPMEA